MDSSTDGISTSPDVNSSVELFSNSSPGFKMIEQYANIVLVKTDPSSIYDDISNLETQSAKERHRVSGRLAGFNPKDNPVWREITKKFGTNIKQPDLLNIALILAHNANIKLDRDAKRRKTVLVKWFEENWNAIRPFIDYVILEDTHS